MPLHPQVAALLERVARSPLPPYHTVPAFVARRIYRDTRAVLAPKPPEIAEVRLVVGAELGGASLSPGARRDPARARLLPRRGLDDRRPGYARRRCAGSSPPVRVAPCSRWTIAWRRSIRFRPRSTIALPRSATSRRTRQHLKVDPRHCRRRRQRRRQSRRGGRADGARRGGAAALRSSC